METLVINIPDDKRAIVKQILKELGVTIQQETHSSLSDYKKNITGFYVERRRFESF
ncbi:hypothetical protein LX99_00035 [Mucilaginibacter oryzae]|uniref:Uncharacterized protein n=1 Tax=Mucilaginibacter oryzae TaxID=468058 RepID=A0A316HG74_9SPHI|nr:hypothetical protein [Mucilaginibacter oryzae]PWK79578.1 hypothetical protein LX99_00035 [Mucilaginibacter oryzae]